MHTILLRALFWLVCLHKEAVLSMYATCVLQQKLHLFRLAYRAIEEIKGVHLLRLDGWFRILLDFDLLSLACLAAGLALPSLREQRLPEIRFALRGRGTR
jgi:hypothetical protein